MAKNTYGTGCFMLLNTGEQAVASRNNLVTTVAWKRNDRIDYALEGSVFIAGAVVQWLRDGLQIVRSASEIEALAASVPDNGGVYLVPAFTGLGAPHWDAYARGTMFGLTRGATRAHIARAALEAIAFQSADVLAAMQMDADIALTELRVDGGAAANNLLMQFQADLLGVPVVRPKVLETTALGAAYLAGLAVGYWKSDRRHRRQLAGGSAVRAGDVAGPGRGATGAVGESGRADEGLGVARGNARLARAIKCAYTPILRAYARIPDATVQCPPLHCLPPPAPAAACAAPRAH